MAFLDELRQRNTVLGSPAGGTYGQEAYFGQPPVGGGGFNSGGGNIDIQGLINDQRMHQFNLRNRDISDFAAKTRITGDEAIRQENMRRIFDPNSGAMTTLRPQNTVYQPSIQEQGQITPIDQAKLSIAREQAQGTPLDRAEFGLKQKQYELDKTKNDQIYGTKQADMQRKADEAEANLKLAYNKLQLDQGNAANVAAYHDAQMNATNARMALMGQQHAADLAEQKRLHDAQIADMKTKLDQSANSGESVDVWTDDQGIQHRTTNTRKGSPSGKTIRVISPDGKHGNWNADKPLPQGWTRIGQ